MKTSAYLYWAGWSVILSGVAMILGVVFLLLAVSTGEITPGTHTHSILTETFDTLTTAFLIPLPFAYYLLYKKCAARVSFLSTLVGAVTFLGATVLHVLLVFEVLWFSDPLPQYLYGLIGVGIAAWLLMTAYLANRSGKPAHGVILNIIGASIIGLPVWLFSTGYLLISGRLTDRLA